MGAWQQKRAMYPDPKLNLSYETDNAIYWFSHAFDPLNNWSAHALTIWGKLFPTVEHGFHYRKFDDTAPEVAAEIIVATSPWAAMQIERKHVDRRRKDWHDVKVGIMTELVRAKITQNEDVKSCLLNTGTKTIVENSPWDNFWGIGHDGNGQNCMGKILMLIRDELHQH